MKETKNIVTKSEVTPMGYTALIFCFINFPIHVFETSRDHNSEAAFPSCLKMTPRREGLRNILPKPPKKKAKTNAEKCREYRMSLKDDPTRLEDAKLKKRDSNQQYRLHLTPEQKERKKEQDRIAQQKRREKLKQEGVKPPTPRVVAKQPAATRKQLKEAELKVAERRENARLRQQNRRLNMSSQKKRREKEKRMERYYRGKPCDVSSVSPPRKRRKFHELLKTVKTLLTKRRSCDSLKKKDFVNHILKNEVPPTCTKNYYQRAPAVLSTKIQKFYDKVSVDLPCKKGSATEKKVLSKSLLDTFQDFKTENPSIKISYATFKRRRPSHIALYTSRKFIQCLCEKCTNVMLLMNVFNSFLDKKPMDKEKINIASKVTFVEELVEKTLCREVKRECISRECDLCGVEPFISLLHERIKEVKNVEKDWKRWEKTDKSSKDLVCRSSALCNILDTLKSDLVGLGMHIKTAQWQRKQYQQFADNIPPFHGICTVDFAENYVCKYQFEVQSAHWSYRQITVHPCVFFYKCPKEGCGKRLTDYLIILSDDNKHDSFFSKCVLDECLSYANSKGLLALHIVSDGCSSQYKSKVPFFHLTELQLKHSQMNVTRHYFGSNHGKSLCDSAGGIVKNRATRAVASGEVIIQNAKEMLQFCQQKLSLGDENHLSHVCRSFVLFDGEKIDRSSIVSDLKVLKGTRSIHCIVPTKEIGILKTKLLSCFCSVCLLGEEGTCPNISFTHGWQSAIVRKGNALHSNDQHFPSVVQPLPLDSVTITNALDTSLGTSDLSTVLNYSDDDSVLDIGLCDPISVSPNPDKSFPSLRKIFFAHIQEELSSCKTFHSLHEMVVTIEPLISQHPLPDITPKSFIDVKGTIDKDALNLVPDDIKTKLYPVLTVPDGNCVPRALSLLVFGDQDHHQEIRCRIVSELVENSAHYLSNDVKDLKAISELSDFYSGDVEETFQLEVLHVSKMSTFMGIWQLMSACNVFRTPLSSIYPSVGLRCHHLLLNRTFSPRIHLPSTRIFHDMHLFWSSTRSDMSDQYWTANHVVPLMPLYIDVEPNLND